MTVPLSIKRYLNRFKGKSGKDKEVDAGEIWLIVGEGYLPDRNLNGIKLLADKYNIF